MSLQRVFRFLLIGIIALLLAVTLSPLAGVVAAAATGSTAVHYIYAGDGLCPDSISGYQIAGGKLAPTPGSPYSAGRTSCTDTQTFGFSTLAATPGNATHGPCLVHSDVVLPQVESFAINPTTGALTLVSVVSGLSADQGALSKAISISSSGNLVYVSINPSSVAGNISSLTLGAGCTLKLDQQVSVPTQIYDSFLLLSPGRLVAIAGSKSGIDTYALTSNGGMSLVNSVAGQLSSADGVAAQTFKSSTGQQTTNLYTGQFQLSINPGSTAQAGQYTPSTGAFSPLATSPQTDPHGLSLDYLVFNKANHRLIGSETFAETLGIWSAAGSSFSFLNEVHLPKNVFEPTVMSQLGSQLFILVHGLNSGAIVRCAITAAAPGLQHCSVVANLNGGSDTTEGMAIL